LEQLDSVLMTKSHSKCISGKNRPPHEIIPQ